MVFLHSDGFKYVVGLFIGWLGIVIGWLLQEISHSLADRRERRRAISLALTDLWDIEHHFHALNFVLEKLGSLVAIPPQAKAQVWVVFEQLILPDPAELHKRYNQSVTTLASLDPVLGFRLRSKDLVRPLLTFLNSVAAQSPESAVVWFRLQKPLLDQTNKALKDAVLELARGLGRGTHRRVLKRLEHSADVPKELDDWLKLVIEEAGKQKAMPSPQSAQQTPARKIEANDAKATMPDPDKVVFIKAYFDNLAQRIENLAKLNASPEHRDEALILSLVYVDGLASNYYGGEAVKENFCKALRELSGNPIFAKLHAKMLLDPSNDKHWQGVKPAIESLVKTKAGELLDESEVAAQIRASGIPQQHQDALIARLWRSSVGAICYEVMRNSAVHGLGTGTLSFDETVYEGKLGFALNFDLLHAALRRMSDHIAKESIQKGEWFGRKDYFKTR
jgi:hypothetical protein